MTTHIVLLRGVNLGNHNKLNMKKLCDALTKFGLEEVRSYIQSGNLFVKSKKKVETLENEIHDLILKTFNLDVPVIVVEKKIYKDYIENFPFENRSKEWENYSYVTFLSESPSKKNLDGLLAEQTENDKIIVYNQIAYLFLGNKYHEAKINNNFIEKKLGFNCSTRNWKTFKKMDELIGE